VPINPLDRQIGGSHYKTCTIQPVEYIHKNNLGFLEGNIIKYVTRWKRKADIQDLEKAKHYIELLIEMEKSDETNVIIASDGERLDWRVFEPES
jgi:hypothetical protein